jgi:putative chitinase
MKNLEKIIPQNILPYIEETFNLFEINTPLRASHFLAQVMHESLDFKFKEENLNYSVKGLLKYFKKYFSTEEIAKQYAGQPQKIASRVYANRYGNGDEKSGDGWKFTGRGDMQTTFHDNYLALGGYLKIDLISNPDLVTTPRYARLSAGYYWYKNKLNLIADKGNSDEVVKSITKKVNGGYNGLDDRLQRFQKIFNILKV